MYTDLVEDIERLKKEQDAVILAHYYEDGEIQDIADYIGDSYYLSKTGQELNNRVILLAGVVFMAESVKLLNPEKTVVVPDMNAGCSLVNGAPYDKYLAWKNEHPDGIVMTYINSSAAVKSISDVICTSTNAEKIVRAIPEDRPILFGPDKNLGRYLAKQTGREMILWPGACEVHVLFNQKMLFELKVENPDATILAHPECEDPILEMADVVGSTSRLLKEATEGPAEKYIVVTEAGIIHQMKKARPGAEFIPAPVDENCACNNCPYMKMNTLEKIRDTLQGLTNQVELEPHYINGATASLDRMMKISTDQPIQWA